MKEAALDLLCKREFSVIPLRPHDKKPMLPSWAEYQRRLPSEEEVDLWWTQWPDANIGIVTGAISGLVVVDVDGAEGLKWMKVNGRFMHNRVYATPEDFDFVLDFITSRCPNQG